MKEPIYRLILRDAWQLAWRNKILWLFGFFAGLLINGGVYDLAVKMFSRVTATGITWENLTANALPPFQFVADFAAIGAPIESAGLFNAWVIMVLIAAVALGLFLFWLAVVSQGTLVHAVGMASKKKEDIKKSFQAGLEKFWPILSINLLLKLTIFLLVVFTSFPLIMLLGDNALLNAILYLVSFIIFIPLAIIGYFVAILATCYIILRGKKFGQSLFLAWELFKRNWLICLELGFLLFVVGFLVGLLVILLFLLASIPVVLLLLAALALGSEVASLLVIALAIIILVALIVVSGAFIVTFQYASWVLLFERLTTKGGFSRLVRWIKGLETLHGESKKPKKKKRKKSRSKKAG